MPELLLPPAVRPAPVELLRVADAMSGFRSLRDSARYHRVRPGVYTPQVTWRALTPWKRYLARVHAYALINSDAIFAYESAAALLGLPLFGEPRDIHVFDFGRTGSRRFGDVWVHASIDERVIEVRDGLSMTSPAHTAVDLMRVLPVPFGLAVGDAVTSPVQAGTVTPAQLETTAAGQTNSRGRRPLALVLATVDRRSESPGESIGRAVIIWSGFEPPELQVEFRFEGHVDRVDYGWPGVRALAESDGYAKYQAESTDEAVRRVVAEKRREDRLRRQCRAFGRWDMAAAIAVNPVVAELSRLGVPRVGAPHTALLSTMRANPRSFPSPKQRNRDETPPR